MESIEEFQQKYAEYCGYKDFDELRGRDEKALRVYYLKIFEPKEE